MRGAPACRAWVRIRSGQNVTHQKSQTNEIPVGHTTDNPMDNSSGNPLGKCQSFGTYHWKVNIRWNMPLKPHRTMSLIIIISFLSVSLLFTVLIIILFCHFLYIYIYIYIMYLYLYLYFMLYKTYYCIIIVIIISYASPRARPCSRPPAAPRRRFQPCDYYYYCHLLLLFTLLWSLSLLFIIMWGRCVDQGGTGSVRFAPVQVTWVGTG